jgi:predicted dehydrogenase
LFSSTLLKLAVHVRGDRGELRVFNALAPQFYHRLTVRTARGKSVEHVTRVPTYTFQLRAFAAAVLHGTPTLTPPADAVANMRLIDAVYRAAGQRPRG